MVDLFWVGISLSVSAGLYLLISILYQSSTTPTEESFKSSRSQDHFHDKVFLQPEHKRSTLELPVGPVPKPDSLVRNGGNNRLDERKPSPRPPRADPVFPKPERWRCSTKQCGAENDWTSSACNACWVERFGASSPPTFLGRFSNATLLLQYDSIEKLRSKSVTIVSCMPSAGLKNSSLAAICAGFETAHGHPLKVIPRTTKEKCGLAEIYFAKTPPNVLFGSLWVVELSSNFDESGISPLYRTIKRELKEMTRPVNGDGRIAMVLVGARDDKFIERTLLEVVSLLDYASSHVPALRSITVYVRPEKAGLVQSALGRGRLSELLGRRKPSELPLSTDIERLKAELNRVLESESFGADFFDLIQAQLERISPRDAAGFPLLASTVCVQARRMLEHALRAISGDPKLNAGFSVLERIAKDHRLDDKIVSSGRIIIQNGNKAAHAAEPFTVTEVNLTLQAVIDLINRLPKDIWHRKRTRFVRERDSDDRRREHDGRVGRDGPPVIFPGWH